MSTSPRPLARSDHVSGPDDAPLVIEYGDYECPYSRAAYRHVQRLTRRLDGRLRFAFRHFPLAKHPHAQMASEVAEAAAAQGRFWAMHDILFRRQTALEPGDLRAYADQLGLDMARFDAEVESGAHRARVAEDVTRGRADGVRSIPVLFAAGERVDGSDWGALVAALGGAGAQRPDGTSASSE